MKRVLVICYYWPPAGGPGVQRWLKFVKYLPDHGVEPVVFVPDNPSYPIVDETLANEVSADLEMISCPINEPYKWAKLIGGKKSTDISKGVIPKDSSSMVEKAMLAVRGNFFIPDARVGWVKPAVKKAGNYLQDHPVSAIITTGPPHSVHLIGMKLKQQFDIPWVADFRDPWTTIHYHQELRLGKRAKRLHQKMEAQVLQSADLLLVTSPGTKAEFEKKSATPVHLITNGFDGRPEGPVQPHDHFSLTHIGSLLTERDPAPVWEALAELIREEDSFKQAFKLHLAGVVGKEVYDSLDRYDLRPYLVDHAYLSHQQALMLQSSSSLLLLLEMNKPETRAIIPGKLFEYMSSGRPILALGPQGSDVAPLLRQSGAGSFFSWEEKQAIKLFLLNAFRDYKAGRLKGTDPNRLERYSRESLSGQLAKLLGTL